MPLRGIFRNLSTFKMKLFSRIVDGKKPLIIAKKPPSQVFDRVLSASQSLK